MAQVNNATGVFATLGYNFSDPNGYIKQFSANTQVVMNQFPPIIKKWQANDIANNSVGNYFKNPVSNSITTIINNAISMYIVANTASTANSSYTGSANVSGICSIANTLIFTANNFLAHTNRVSGVTSMSGQTDTVINPYYQTSVGFGKQAIYITNQTDGVINNSPILGCMTSILIGPQLTSNATTASNDLITLTNGISANTLSNAQVSQITTDLYNINNYLLTMQTNDVSFFANLQNLINNYNITKQFTNMGETENYLVNNFVGTPSLIVKINS